MTVAFWDYLLQEQNIMKNNNTKSYDLSLGKWGPYNKKYLGVCHIDNKKNGSAFCVELFPGFIEEVLLCRRQ